MKSECSSLCSDLIGVKFIPRLNDVETQIQKYFACLEGKLSDQFKSRTWGKFQQSWHNDASDACIMTDPTEELRVALTELAILSGKDGSTDIPSQPRVSNIKIWHFLAVLQSAVLNGDWRTLKNKNLLSDITETISQDAFKQELLSMVEQRTDEVVSSYNKIITGLAQHAMLPSVQNSEDEDYPEDNFVSTQLNTYISARIINLLLTNLWEVIREVPDGVGDTTERGIVKACVSQCIVLCASHRHSHPWTDSRSRHETQELLDTLCKISSSANVSELLCGKASNSDSQGRADEGQTTRGGFTDVLGILRHRLTRQSWKQEPASRHVFFWCLIQVKHPHLGDHLDIVLPPSLLFIDDYKVENKIHGAQCLQHIIDNVDPTEVRWYGRGVVIYEALQHHLYSQNAALLMVLYPCLLGILGVIEKAPHKADLLRQPNRYDAVFQTILCNMEFEQKLILRNVHAQCLSAFIEKMSITVLRHMKRLLRVLTNYLEVYDGAEQTARVDILHGFKALIVQAWPRIPNHCDAIMKSLLRLLYDITTCDVADVINTVQSQLISLTEECLLLLKRCCGTKVDLTLQSVQGCEASNQLIDQCIQTVLAGT